MGVWSQVTENKNHFSQITDFENRSVTDVLSQITNCHSQTTFTPRRHIVEIAYVYGHVYV